MRKLAVSALVLASTIAKPAYGKPDTKVTKKALTACAQSIWATLVVPPGDITVACKGLQTVEVTVSDKKFIHRTTMPVAAGSACVMTDEGDAMLQRGSTVNTFGLDSEELGKNLDWAKLALSLSIEPGDDAYDWLYLRVAGVKWVSEESPPPPPPPSWLSLGIGGLGTYGHGRGTGGYENIDLGGRGWDGSGHVQQRETCVVQSDTVGIAIPQIITHATGFKLESVVTVKRLIADRCLAGFYLERQPLEATADNGE